MSFPLDFRLALPQPIGRKTIPVKRQFNKIYDLPLAGRKYPLDDTNCSFLAQGTWLVLPSQYYLPIYIHIISRPIIKFFLDVVKYFCKVILVLSRLLYSHFYNSDSRQSIESSYYERLNRGPFVGINIQLKV